MPICRLPYRLYDCKPSIVEATLNQPARCCMFHQALQGVALDPVVLWKTEAITCSCRRQSADRVEVRLIVGEVIIQRKFFDDVEDASQFALDKMHAYNAH